jgi:hypothetical protein
MTEEDEEFNRIEREATTRKAAVAATVAKREWVGLTDEEMDELVNRFARYELVRAVEAKLRENNT